MMIDWNKSADLNKCGVNELKARFERFPKSNKKIIAICDNPECDNPEREILFYGYRNLCHLCSKGTIGAREKASEITKKQFEDPEARKKHGELIKKVCGTPEERKKNSDRMKKAQREPEVRKKHSKTQKERFKNPEERENLSIVGKKRFEEPEAHERASASRQGIPFDEWIGYTNKNRPHLIPCHACIQINQKFEGCNQHHIMTGVVINMPVDIHRSISHQFPNGNKGKNMKEINELAFKYLMGDI